MSDTLEIFLIIFVAVLIVISIILCVYLIKFLKETTLTLKSIKELSDMTKNELQPSLKSISNVLKTVDDVSSATNKKFGILKKILSTAIGAAVLSMANFKKQSGFFSGFLNGFKIFSKRR